MQRPVQAAETATTTESNDETESLIIANETETT